jgi:ornithine carbamoyltransferase
MEKDFISFGDLNKDEIQEIFTIAGRMKSKTVLQRPLDGKILAMLFEKPSLRTRFTFEAGMFELGGHSIYLAPSDIGLGKRESVKDVALNLSRWADGIMARTFSHTTILELAKYAKIPVINALSDIEHPCQALSDVFTIYEKQGDLEKLVLAYIGDGNNVCHSLMLASQTLGMKMKIATPEGYKPLNDYIEKSNPYITHDPYDAVRDADVVYTDVWTSMGKEDEREERKKRFQLFQVNEKLIENAKVNVLVMHCLPAHRGEEITDKVIDGPHSIVLDQAENRLHVQKALLVKLLK